MQAITIAERLWLEPTILGATLNFSDEPHGWNYRVGISFQSLSECDKSLTHKGSIWTMRDKSLTVQGDRELILTFCPGTYMERCVILKGDEKETFKSAVRFLTLASLPQQN